MSADQRKYSIDEIDRMRRAVKELSMGWTARFYSGSRALFEPSFEEIEGKLRTYMLNGTAPEELDEVVGEDRARLEKEQARFRNSHLKNTA